MALQAETENCIAAYDEERRNMCDTSYETSAKKRSAASCVGSASNTSAELERHDSASNLSSKRETAVGSDHAHSQYELNARALAAAAATAGRQCHRDAFVAAATDARVAAVDADETRCVSFSSLDERTLHSSTGSAGSIRSYTGCTSPEGGDCQRWRFIDGSEARAFSSDPAFNVQTSREMHVSGSSTADKIPCPKIAAKQAECTRATVNPWSDSSPEDIFAIDKQHPQRGPYGSIVGAVDLRDGSPVDIQIINLADDTHELFSLSKDLIALAILQHEGLTEHLGYYFLRRSRQLWAVARRPAGSSLADCLQSESETPFSEKRASDILKKCLKVLQYLQGQNFTHSLINATNVYITADDDLQLSCLGCCTMTRSSSLHRQKGHDLAQHYGSAPEIIMRKPSSAKVGSWCLGVLAYELLHGRRPYHELQPTEALAKVARTGLRKFVKTVKASPEATNFLDRCLRKRPLKRASIDEVSRHPFLRKASAELMVTSPAA